MTKISAFIDNVDTKEIIANISINLTYEENGAPKLTIEYNTSAVETEERRRRLEEVPFPEIINGIRVRKENCTLTVTKYGDMSSFVGLIGNREGIIFEADSTGYVDSSLTGSTTDPLYIDIVEEFPCEGNTENGTLSLNATADMTTDLGGLAGKGLLLKLVETELIIGYSVITPDNGVPKADVIIKDVIAVCQESEKLSLMIYSDKATDDKTLRAHFQPQTKEIIDDSANVVVEFIVSGEDPVRISNFKPDSNGCVELFYTSPSASPLFLFFLKGKPVSINLLRGGQYVFSEPVQCALGSKNEDPDLFLDWESFCDKTLPPLFDDTTEDTTETTEEGGD